MNTASHTESNRTAGTRNRLLYWAITGLLMVPGAGGGVVELLTGGPESVAHTLLALGYPLYIMKILGLAKVLGVSLF